MVVDLRELSFTNSNLLFDVIVSALRRCCHIEPPYWALEWFDNSYVRSFL